MSLISFSQNQTDNQYLQRNAGMKYDYCSNSYIAMTNSQFEVDFEQLTIGYAPYTISDKYGSLLFYTDGRTIWNRNQNILPSANEDNNTDIEGHSNTIILPQPGNANRYYVFALDNPAFWNTLDDAPGPVPDDGVNNGLTYSIIDQSLNSGNGDIIPDQHNVPLITYNENDSKEIEYKCSSKLTVVRGSDCQSYWIITHFISSFYAFKLDSSGLNPEPVISSLAPLQSIIDLPNSYWYHDEGEMKSSPDGSKIAVAHTYLDNVEINGTPGGFYLYDFNNETGKLSNIKTLFSGQDQNEYPSSLEFSQSSRYLYGSTSNVLGEGTGSILRWDTEDANIANSVQTISNDDSLDPKLQLGSDDKIHKSLSAVSGGDSDHVKYLGTLTNIDGPAQDINYLRQALLLDLSGNFDNVVLNRRIPEFNRQWYNSRTDIINNGVSRCELYLCDNESKTLTTDFIIGADYVWSKDGTVITTATSHTLEVSDVGFFEVFIEPNDGRCPIEGRATVLLSNDIPNAQDANLIQCDDNSDGLTTFNLSLINETVSNNEANRIVRYYGNLVDLNDGINEINASNYQNTSNPQTVYALVISTENGCTDIAEVNLSVSVTSVNGIELSGCDTDGNSDGFGIFNLSDAESQILNNLPDGLDITFHESYEDALNATSLLNFDYSNIIPYNQTLFVRVVNGLDCYGINEIDLTVYDIPELETDSETLYCLNNSPNTITLNSGLIGGNSNNYSYLWSNGETTSQIEINETGTYSVEVTSLNGCTNQRSINVIPSNIATITDIQIAEISTDNSISVFVTGEGDYEYALNNIDGFYQDNNNFNNLQPGSYTIFVRDKNNCGIVNEVVSILGFPKFFTPNGDAVNDTWQIKGMTPENQIISPILIFNRYGKLIIEIDTRSIGWDGTLNGSDLPSNDYWFRVTLNDGRVFSSHFALKR